eukprot:6860129-Prymnesium_polylepis.1
MSTAHQTARFGRGKGGSSGRVASHLIVRVLTHIDITAERTRGVQPESAAAHAVHDRRRCDDHPRLKVRRARGSTVDVSNGLASVAHAPRPTVNVAAPPASVYHACS